MKLLNCNILKGLLAAMLFAACQSSPLISEYQSVPLDGWRSDSALVFALPPAEVEGEHRLNVMVRATDDYKYADLALQVEHVIAGKVAMADTVTLHLFNNKETEKSQPARFLYVNRSTQTSPIRPAVSKDGQPVNQAIRVKHIMRLDPLVGIESIGIEVTAEQ